jgi:hypothetical protein
MKTKKIKAKKMYGGQIDTPTVVLYGTKNTGHAFVGKASTPAFILPADIDSILRMTTQAAEGLHAHMLTNKEWSPYELTRAALSAIGINVRVPKS